jgi:hypothetical protein
MPMPPELHGWVLHTPGSTTPRHQLPQHAGRFFSLLASVSGETTIFTPSPGLVGLSSDANACKRPQMLGVAREN